MPTSESNYTVTAEKVDFRTLGVLFEQAGRKLSMLFEESPDTNGSWIATTDLSHWQTGEAIADSERQDVLARLNEWGRTQGWRFEVGIKLLDIRLENVPPEHRDFIRTLQDAGRQQQEQRRKIYGQK